MTQVPNSHKPLRLLVTGWYSSLAQRWPRRDVQEENIVQFLLGVRWLSLLPPLLIAAWQVWPLEQGALWWATFGIALVVNLAVSFRYRTFRRVVMDRPWLLGLDLAFGALLLALTGGSASPYFFYALTPVLAGAFLFAMRGGLLVTLAFLSFYALALLWSHRVGEVPLRPTDVVLELGVLYGAALAFGYQAFLLRRLRASRDELNAVHEELSRAETLAALGKMVAHVSHEIRNPLVTLGGYAHAIARRPEDTEKVRRRAEVIAAEIGRLEELLDDLLNLARPHETAATPGSLQEVLDRACLLTCDNWAEHKILLRKDYDAALPPILMNASALLRAFLNVTRNAVQAMPDGGSLTVSTRCVYPEVVVTVTDTGHGIAPDELAEIWTPFVTHRERGTGLGLPVTQQILTEHGGRIEVESQKGQGTSFLFYLPLGIASPAELPLPRE